MSIFLLISSCNSSKETKNKSLNITGEERLWLEQFFKTLMFENKGIYTLYGSKPMTSMVVYYYSQEEINEIKELMTEEEKRNSVTVEDDFFSENWEKWTKIQDRFPMKRYLLFKQDIPDDPKVAFVYFVDILNLALTLNEHYPMIKTIIDEDFNPFDVASECADPNSEFWKKIESHSALTGILFGYGAKNSWCFHWKHWDHSDQVDTIAQSIKFHFSDNSRYGQATLKNFPIPIFASFANGKDEVIEKYEKEREQIKKIYKGKDFLETTLKKLMGSE